MALSKRQLRELAARHGEATTRIRRAMVRAKMEGRQAVAVEHVLDLLDPEGAWTYGEPQPEEAAAPPDPREDPITGCLPVTAEPGSH